MPRMVERTLVVGAACATFALNGCSSDKTGPAPTGALSLTVTAAGGTTPAVSVSGPDGYGKSFSHSQVLMGLALGTYTIAADSVTVPDPVVGGSTDTAHVTGNPAVVASHDTVKAMVKYALGHQYGAMWVASVFGTQLDGFAGPQLHAAGSPAPTDSVGITGGASAMALDANGNLWTVGSNNHQIRMYTPAQRGTLGDTASATVIVDDSLDEPLSMAFDKQGNLWVSDLGRLKAYTPAHLAAGGTQSPDIEIISTALTEDPGLAFDSTGNLWVSSYDNSTLVKYDAAQLAASDTVAPVDTLHSITALDGPGGMQFDAHGNLWVANHSTNTILMFAPSQLTASGSPTPQVIITTPTSTGSEMWGLVFDASGSLWVAASGSDSVMAFTASELTGTGSPTPAVLLGGASAGQFNFLSTLVLDPSMSLPADVGQARVASPRSTVRTARPRALRRPATPFFQTH
jgi:sugar lactone lactonase YvrE